MCKLYINRKKIYSYFFFGVGSRGENVVSLLEFIFDFHKITNENLKKKKSIFRIFT